MSCRLEDLKEGEETLREYAILFLVGKDRPGIVDDVTECLLNQDANIEDSSMTLMGGRFTVVLFFSCPSGRQNGIKAALEGLEREGFAVSLHEAEDPAALPKIAQLPLKIEVRAMDHPAFNGQEGTEGKAWNPCTGG